MMTTQPAPQPVSKDDSDLTPLHRRLRRVAGQVLGIDRMLAEERTCEAVLIQLAAVQGALRAVAQQVLACHLTEAMGAVGTGSLPAVAAAEEAAYLSALLAGIPSPRGVIHPAARQSAVPESGAPQSSSDEPPART